MSSIDVGFNYLDDMDEKPVLYVTRPPPGVPRGNSKVVQHRVTVANGRLIADELSLDGAGVCLVRSGSAVRDFYDAQAVRAVYYPEVERLVAETTGATRVHAFDHNVRCAAMADRRENGAQRPVKFAHNDYTESSAPQRVRDLLPDEAETLLEERFAVINVWRPIRGPVQKNPLAVCDARTIAEEDLVETNLEYADRTGKVQSLAFNEAHRWIYFPRMQADEVLLIKCYDSHSDRARFTAHGAFDDPSTPEDADERESVEVRTLAFFAGRQAAD